MKKVCCVPGCEETAKHGLDFTVELGGWGGGEFTTSSDFCCGHFDMLAQDGPPHLDLVVIGVVREPKA